MTRPAIQVGDHTPEPASFITPQRRAELFVIRKTEWSVTELRALATKLDDATKRLEIARTNEHFAGMRSAYLDIAEASDQLAFLTTGVGHAIASASKKETTAHD